MCGEAAKLCERDDEKKLVIEVLRRNPSTAGLALVIPYLASAELKTEAGDVAVSIAEKVVKTDPAAVASAMKQLLEGGGDQKVLDRAKALAEQAAQKSSAEK